MRSSTISDPTNSTRSSPNIAAADAVLHIGSSILIDAPSTEVWRILTDTSTWPSWNSFCPRAAIREQPDSDSNTNSAVLQKGTRMTFHVRMNPSSESEQEAQLAVTEFDPPDSDSSSGKLGRVVWAGDSEASGSFPGWLLTAERVHEFKDVDVEVEGGETKRMTEVRNWEIQVGYMAYVVRWMFGGVLQKDFETWVLDLKNFVEGRESG